MFKSKAALIGTGFIGPVHVEALHRAGVDVIGVLGSSAASSSRAADQLGLDKAYSDLDDLMSDDDVDVVHVASPNHLHFEHASRALRSGKHVVCEKPLAMNSSHSEQLVRLAGESDRIAAVCHNIRYYPLCIEARQRVAAGDVGELFHVTGSYVQDWLFHPSDFNWRVTASQGGPLRALADIGTHWLDLVQYVTGQRVVEVCTDLQTVHPVRQKPLGGAKTYSGGPGDRAETEDVAVDTEDFGSVMLRLDGGAAGQFYVSQVTAGRKNQCRFDISGAGCSLAWDSQRPNELFVGHRDRANESLIRDPSLLSSAAAGAASYPGGHNEGFHDTFKQLFRSVYAAIEDPTATDAVDEAVPGCPTFADGHREVLLCEAMLESHRTRRWVTLETGDV